MKTKSLLAAVATLLFISSCSQSSNQEDDFTSNLPENSEVLLANFLNGNKEIIYSQITDDGEQVIFAKNLKEDHIDTVMVVSDGVACDVVVTDSCYLVVTKTDISPRQAYFDYHVAFVNKKDNTIKSLTLGDEGEDITTEAYIVDTKEGIVILKGSCYNDNQAIFYHSVFDFQGDKIMEDPTVIDLNPKVIEDTPTMYIWECQKCGKKRNSVTKPETNVFVDVCPDGKVAHNYVKIGKI